MKHRTKLFLVAFAIVAGTLLLMAGAGTGPRYVGRFFGDGTGLSNSVDLVEGPNILITPGPGNRAYTIESTAAGAAGIFTNGIMGYGDEYRTNYVRISPSGVSLTGGGAFAGDGSGLTNIPKGAIVGLTNLSNLTITNGARMTNVTTLGLTNYGNLGTYNLHLWDPTQTTWTRLFVDDFTFNFSGLSVSNALFYGDGGGLTGLDGSQVTAGTVADARIASTIARDSEVTTATQNSTNAGNIAFLPADNVFTGTSNHFNGAIGAASFSGSLSTASNLPGIISVADFGATTNSADNAAAFAAAIQAATNSTYGAGGTVMVPAGYWTNLSTLQLYPGITLQGAGPNATTLFFTGTISNLTEFVRTGYGSNLYSPHVGWKSLAIKSKTTDSFTGDAISVQAGHTDVQSVAPVIEDVYIEAYARNAVQIYACNGGKMDNLIAYRYVENGVVLGGTDSTNRFRGITPRNCQMQGGGTGYGWKVIGASAVKFDACTADDDDAGGWYFGGNCQNVGLKNCGSENNGGSLYYVDDVNGLIAEGCYATQLDGGATNGWWINGGDYVQVKGGTMQISDGWAFYLTADPQYPVLKPGYMDLAGADGALNDESLVARYDYQFSHTWRYGSTWTKINNGKIVANGTTNRIDGLYSDGIISSGTINATNGFKVGGLTGIDKTFTLYTVDEVGTGRVTNSIVITKGIITQWNQ